MTPMALPLFMWRRRRVKHTVLFAPLKAGIGAGPQSYDVRQRVRCVLDLLDGRAPGLYDMRDVLDLH